MKSPVGLSGYFDIFPGPESAVCIIDILIFINYLYLLCQVLFDFLSIRHENWVNINNKFLIKFVRITPEPWMDQALNKIVQGPEGIQVSPRGE